MPAEPGDTVPDRARQVATKTAMPEMTCERNEIHTSMVQMAHHCAEVMAVIVCICSKK